MLWLTFFKRFILGGCAVTLTALNQVAAASIVI